jgi:hypothetical protein
MSRTAAREAVTEILLRSITDLHDFVRLLDEAGWTGSAAALRRKLAERPVISGVPKINPGAWKRGTLKFPGGPSIRKTDGGLA